MKLLDSDHWIAVFRGKLDLTQYIMSLDEVVISAPTVGELVHGAAKSGRVTENMAQIDFLLAEIEVLPYDAEAARLFGALKADLERQGRRIPDLDLQIASIALRYSVVLVTHNQDHFRRVPDLDLENWLM